MISTDRYSSCWNWRGAISTQIEEGFQQGLPRSPSLYNMFMDSFAVEILGSHNEFYARERGLIIFANDVKIFADSQNAPDETLWPCDKWANDHGMCWSTKKCIVLQDRCGPTTRYQLNGSQLKSQHCATYLGVMVSRERKVLENITVERIKAATADRIRNIVITCYGRDKMSMWETTIGTVGRGVAQDKHGADTISESNWKAESALIPYGKSIPRITVENIDEK